MKNLSLARPYARAAYLYAKEKGVVESWFDFLAELGLLFADHKMLLLLKNPKLCVQVLQNVLCDHLRHLPTDAMRNYLAQLAANKRLDYLPEIVELFARDWQHDRTVREVEVVSTIELREDELLTIQKSLTQQFNQHVFLKPSIDPSLIGGMMIRSGDYVMDGSLLGQLKRLKQTLMQ